MFTFGVIAIEVWHTSFPIWAFVLALIICTLNYSHLIPSSVDVRIISIRVHRPHRRDSGHH
jgi:hypothetical protein